jgi:hypothetical protein
MDKPPTMHDTYTDARGGDKPEMPSSVVLRIYQETFLSMERIKYEISQLC